MCEVAKTGNAGIAGQFELRHQQARLLRTHGDEDADVAFDVVEFGSGARRAATARTGCCTPVIALAIIVEKLTSLSCTRASPTTCRCDFRTARGTRARRARPSRRRGDDDGARDAAFEHVFGGLRAFAVGRAGRTSRCRPAGSRRGRAGSARAAALAATLRENARRRHRASAVRRCDRNHRPRRADTPRPPRPASLPAL